MGARRVIGAIVAAAACGGGGAHPAADGKTGDGAPGGDASSGPGLSTMYPGDTGIGGDPAVVWYEDFEEGSVAAVTARYDQADGTARMMLTADQPAASAGHASMSLTAGNGVAAVDLYKQLPDHDELYVRWYAKYQALVPWHHSGMWFGGYDPAMPYPSPMAGYQPAGDDRFSIAVEPVYNVGAMTTRFDTYNYWMTMHSWMPPPINNDGTAYYGNALVHANSFTLDEGGWVCLEVHVKLGAPATGGAGTVLEIWKNDTSVIRFDDTSPLGYWIRDKFCTPAADGSECTDYPAPFDTRLDLELRSTSQLALNAFWPQNYITDTAEGTLAFDQMVVATQRVGCIH